MLTQDELERERYESRQKAIRDQISLLEEALRAMEAGRTEGQEKGREEGLREGREQGRQEGVDAGQWIGRIHLCQRRLGRVPTPTSELAALPVQELEQLATDLERELFGS